MDDKKDSSKTLELLKTNSKSDIQKRNFPNFKTPKSKFSMKKVGRSRTQKGQKSY